jgi:hypothetical protein
MEATGTSETSANFCETKRRNIPEGGHLHIPAPKAAVQWLAIRLPNGHIPV